MRYAIGDWVTSTSTPGEVLLRLVSQSSQRVELYAGLLAQAYDAAERLSRAEDETVWGLLKSDKEARSAQADQARDDLDRIFNGGGVSALVGNTYGAAKDIGVYRTGETIRGLAELEAKERERCANFAGKAVAAGLNERMVKIAEAQGELIAKLLKAFVAWRTHLRTVSAVPTPSFWATALIDAHCES
jgi:hypothetical protein